MHRIKSIGVLSLAKIQGGIMFALSLLFLPFFLLGGVASVVAGGKEGALGGGMMIGFAIVFPVVYGGMGFVMGAITALIYNLFAKRLGGVEIELTPVE